VQIGLASGRLRWVRFSKLTFELCSVCPPGKSIHYLSPGVIDLPGASIWNGESFKGVSDMRRLILCIVATATWTVQVQASTLVVIETSAFEVPQNGTLNLSAPVSLPAEGSFSISDVPAYTGSGFAVLIMNASVNGADYTYQTGLGTCPGFCGPFPIVIDNVSGTHQGPGGFSTFQIPSVDPTLTVSSGWTLHAITGNIILPADYQVHITVALPHGVAAVPEASTWAMLLIGFTGIGFSAYRRRSRSRYTMGI
jgi:hypothetical protein